MGSRHEEFSVRDQGTKVASLKNSLVRLHAAGPRSPPPPPHCSPEQGDIHGAAAAGTKVLPGEGRAGGGGALGPSAGRSVTGFLLLSAGCVALCCSRRGACLSAFVLLLLAAVAGLIALVVILGSPPHTPGAQACVTLANRTGFLCHDRRSCVPASGVCDGVRTCPHGEDEDEALCRDVPQHLPGFLVARCGNPASWIYSDQKCDGTNNCGDCSDELSPVTTCPPCGPGWWRCAPVVFRYCDCIPRSLCRDRVQHCSDWSDEHLCPGP
ncbi:low-density lipoprotein receptor class A domain-containing protein 1 [Pipistrellus kuhlii]|uniref:low-density lipoprotein receptor class A domain-containing protein 1 n=1 Tax=Pipistrellus kuhlii TaxID=59472 RepID=UPI001E2707DB|nr:low-density lipoprotein receptor class A domain-containing protein 1 [Pipistrellus kuhlii]